MFYITISEKKYLVLLDIDARKRHYHVTESGRVTKFVVQLEVKTGGVWKEVIRYDCVHDYAHKDCHNIKGQCRQGLSVAKNLLFSLFKCIY